MRVTPSRNEDSLFFEANYKGWELRPGSDCLKKFFRGQYLNTTNCHESVYFSKFRLISRIKKALPSSMTRGEVTKFLEQQANLPLRHVADHINEIFIKYEIELILEKIAKGNIDEAKYLVSFRTFELKENLVSDIAKAIGSAFHNDHLFTFLALLRQQGVQVDSIFLSLIYEKPGLVDCILDRGRSKRIYITDNEQLLSGLLNPFFEELDEIALDTNFVDLAPYQNHLKRLFLATHLAGYRFDVKRWGAALDGVLDSIGEPWQDEKKVLVEELAFLLAKKIDTTHLQYAYLIGSHQSLYSIFEKSLRVRGQFIIPFLNKLPIRQQMMIWHKATFLDYCLLFSHPELQRQLILEKPEGWLLKEKEQLLKGYISPFEMEAFIRTFPEDVEYVIKRLSEKRLIHLNDIKQVRLEILNRLKSPKREVRHKCIQAILSAKQLEKWYQFILLADIENSIMSPQDLFLLLKLLLFPKNLVFKMIVDKLWSGNIEFWEYVFNHQFRGYYWIIPELDTTIFERLLLNILPSFQKMVIDLNPYHQPSKKVRTLFHQVKLIEPELTVTDSLLSYQPKELICPLTDAEEKLSLESYYLFDISTRRHLYQFIYTISKRAFIVSQPGAWYEELQKMLKAILYRLQQAGDTFDRERTLTDFADSYQLCPEGYREVIQATYERIVNPEIRGDIGERLRRLLFQFEMQIVNEMAVDLIKDEKVAKGDEVHVVTLIIKVLNRSLSMNLALPGMSHIYDRYGVRQAIPPETIVGQFQARFLNLPERIIDFLYQHLPPVCTNPIITQEEIIDLLKTIAGAEFEDLYGRGITRRGILAILDHYDILTSKEIKLGKQFENDVRAIFADNRGLSLVAAVYKLIQKYDEEDSSKLWREHVNQLDFSELSCSTDQLEELLDTLAAIFSTFSITSLRLNRSLLPEDRRFLKDFSYLKKIEEI